MTHAALLELLTGKRWMQFQVYKLLNDKPEIGLVGDIRTIAIGLYGRLALGHAHLYRTHWSGNWEMLDSKEALLVSGPADQLSVTPTPSGRIIIHSVNTMHPDESMMTVLFPEGDTGKVETTTLLEIHPVDLQKIITVPASTPRYPPGQDPYSDHIPF